MREHDIDFMVVEEIHITDTKNIPTIAGYVWIGGAGSARSKGVVIYMKAEWQHNCRERTSGLD